MVISLSGLLAFLAGILRACSAKTNVARVNGDAGRKKVIATIHLDALPGKQMAIDADLGAERFTDALAGWRREQIAREAAFVSPVLQRRQSGPLPPAPGARADSGEVGRVIAGGNPPSHSELIHRSAPCIGK